MGTSGLHPRDLRALLAALAAPLVLALLLAAPSPAGASQGSTTCPTSNPYPGDAAGQSAIAGWMARSATSQGLPAELPVMAGLVESGLRNLPDSGSGYAGFFQMSTSLFDRGTYAGFETRPELQLAWFTDTAADVRERRLAAGKPDPLADESAWGDWIADVERPATQYRGRYQLRLEEARALVGSGCGAAPPTGGDGGLSQLTLWGGLEQNLGRKVRLAVVCEDACDASATGSLRLPAGGDRFDLEPASGTASGGGEKLKLALAVPRSAAKAARRALRRGEPVKARIDVSATGADGTTADGQRVIRLG